jgi:hypothetical protein
MPHQAKLAFVSRSSPFCRYGHKHDKIITWSNYCFDIISLMLWAADHWATIRCAASPRPIRIISTDDITTDLILMIYYSSWYFTTTFILSPIYTPLITDTGLY